MPWNIYVENIVRKADKRLYVLYQLKRAGIAQKDLITVYQCSEIGFRVCMPCIAR